MESIEAIYEDGVFKPIQPVYIAEHSKVQIRDIRIIGPAVEGRGEPIEDVLMKIANEVPKEEWDKLPEDLTDRLDHYLYGSTED